MLPFAAQMLMALGVLHVIYGLVRFRAPIREAVAEGLVGRFMQSDTRRLAFWFILIGPLLTLIGHIALHAIHQGDLAIVRTIGWYLLGAAAIGLLAFPKSPLWALLPPALIFVASGFGWLR